MLRNASLLIAFFVGSFVTCDTVLKKPCGPPMIIVCASHEHQGNVFCFVKHSNTQGKYMASVI